MRAFRFLAVSFLCIMALVSCKGSQDSYPSQEFATYIKAYTGGVVSSSSHVRIDFAYDVLKSEDAKLFSFSPSLKGEVRWLSSSSVEFLPEEGSLSPGTRYKASFNLAAVTEVRNAALKKFDFSFEVAPKSLSIKLDGVRISADNPEIAKLEGTISLSEPMDVDELASFFDLSGISPSPSLKVLNGSSGNSYRFEIADIHRSKRDANLKIRVDATSKGYASKLTEDVLIPAMSSFKLVSAKLNEGTDPYIELSFSEALDPSSTDKGFLVLEGVGRSYASLDDNFVKLFFDSMPDSSIKLKVSSELKDFAGNRMGEDKELSFNSSAIKPSVSFAFNGSILPDASQLLLPFRAIGLRAVDVSVIRIFEDNILMFLQDNDLNGGDDGLRRSGRLVCRTRVRLDSDPDKDLRREELYSVDLSNLFKKEPGAIYRIRLSFDKDCSIYAALDALPDASLTELRESGLSEEDEAVWDIPNAYYYDNFYDWNSYDWKDSDNPASLSYYMQAERFPYCNLLCSNLGIIAKTADDGRCWISVNDIISAKPISGAEAIAYNFQLQEMGRARTDADGFALLELERKPFAIVVKDGKMTGYLKLADGLEKSLSRFDVGGEKLSSGLKAYIYGERGVWRPGDTLHLSIMVEDKGKLLPENHPLTMELYTPEGQYHSKQSNSSGRNGLYVFHVPTAQDDPTGTWQAYFKIGGAVFHKALPIETIKANRLKITLDTDKDILEAGKKEHLELKSSWLTGPPAAGLKAVVEMKLTKGRTAFKGYEDYCFDNPVSDYSSSSKTIFETVLDDEGKAVSDLIMPRCEDAPGMLNARITTRVMEKGGDASVNTLMKSFAPFPSFVGVKLNSGETLDTDMDHEIPVIVLDAEGKVVVGDHIEYRIFKLDWSWWWESGRESLDSYVNGRGAKAIAEGSFISERTPVKIKFRVDYPEWGRYLIYVKDLSSGHASGGTVYADWPSWRGRSDKRDPDGLTMLSFTTDKKSYELGEDVTVFIPAADGALALVSIENGREVISRQWVHTDASKDTPFKFKLSEDMAPNFYVHISMLQPHSHSANDLPLRMYGVQPVLVENKASHLEPQLTIPDVIRPQEEFTVKIKEKNGKPMSYTLAIVDEGLLDITSFKTPDPWSAMNAREALGVRTWDLYDDVIGAFSGRFAPLMSIGGDIDIQMDNAKDRRFNPVVKFYGPFTLDKGEAKHRITLPMYVGSVRVMLVAARDGAYGSAEKTVPVKNPLMILPTLPRVLGTSEKCLLPVNVFAMEEDVRKVKLSVKVEGPLTVISEQDCSLVFEGNGDSMAFFELASSSQEGIAKVTVGAESSSYKAEETISLEVRNPGRSSNILQTAYIRAGKTERFEFEPSTDSKASLQVSNFPSVDFDGLFDYASDYPYDCTEQLASKGMSLIYIKQFLSEGNAVSADRMINETIKDLYGRQLPDGGFAYWPGQSSADEWVSSMAGQFLVEASKLGYSVNKATLSAWSKFQKKAAQNYKHSSDYRYRDYIQAYRLYTLALASAADEGAMNRLKAAESLTNQARWRLAAAYALAGKLNVAKQLVEKLDTENPDTEPGTYTYGSSKDKAMMLETAVLIDAMQVAVELATEVADEFKKDSWDTQYAAFASLAMNRLAGKLGNTAMDLTLDTGTQREIKSAKSTVTLDIDTSNSFLEIKNLSDGPVYASLLTSRSAGIGEPVPARSSGLSLSVQYSDAEGRDLQVSRLKQGSDFTASIVVTNPDPVVRRSLALTCLIPSGWEILSGRLPGDIELGGECAYKDIRDDRAIWYFDLPASSKRLFTIRLRAAYAGEYALPAISCEAMYDTSVYANTASGKTVVDR